MKFKWATIYSLIFLAFLPLLFFLQALFQQKAFYAMDVGILEIPSHVWYCNNLGSLWNPLLFTGQPHLANPQAAGFAPLHAISLLFSDLWGYSFFIVGHFLVAAVGTFLLFRRWRLSECAALFGAVAFTYGGYFISLGHLPIILTTATYTPWVLYAFSGVIESREREKEVLWTGVTGMMLALQWFGGEPQTLLLTVILAGVLPLWINPRKFFASAIWLGIAFILSMALSAVQIIPFLEFLHFSNRTASLDFAGAAQWSLSPSTLLSFLFPHRLVNTESVAQWGYGFWEDRMPYIFSIHIGVSALVSALIAILRRVYGTLFWVAIFVVGLLLSLGEHSFLYTVVFTVPPFSSFRFPEKYFLWCHVAACFLTASGLQQVLTARPRKGIGINGGFVPLLVACIIWLVFGDSFILRYSTGNSFGSLYLAEQVGYMMVFVFLALLIISYVPGGRLRFAGLTGLLLAELVRAHFFANPVQDITVYDPPPCAAWIMEQTKKTDNHYPRIISLDPRDTKKIHREESLPKKTAQRRRRLSQGVSLQFGINDVRSSYSLHHEGLNRFYEQFAQDRIKTLRMFGVEYVVTPYPLDDENLALQFVDRGEEGSIYVYAVMGTLPRIYMVNRRHQYISEEDFEKGFSDAAFDPSREAWVRQQGVDTSWRKTHGEDGDAVIIRSHRTNDAVDIDLYTTDDRLVVFLETYYPGWKVTVDGERQPIEKVNGFFQGVFVDSGEHKVRFSYHPWSFYVGMAISGFSWVGVLCVMVGTGYHRKRNTYVP